MNDIIRNFLGCYIVDPAPQYRVLIDIDGRTERRIG